MSPRIPTFRITVLVFGFAFLYIPILSLIVYSFNKSRLVTVWGGFSTQWYGKLFENQQILNAAWLSLKIAAINATGAVILGTLAVIEVALNALQIPHGKGGTEAAIEWLGESVSA